MKTNPFFNRIVSVYFTIAWDDHIHTNLIDHFIVSIILSFTDAENCKNQIQNKPQNSNKQTQSSQGNTDDISSCKDQMTPENTQARFSSIFKQPLYKIILWKSSKTIKKNLAMAGDARLLAGKLKN